MLLMIWLYIYSIIKIWVIAFDKLPGGIFNLTCIEGHLLVCTYIWDPGKSSNQVTGRDRNLMANCTSFYCIVCEVRGLMLFWSRIGLFCSPMFMKIFATFDISVPDHGNRIIARSCNGVIHCCININSGGSFGRWSEDLAFVSFE